MAASDGPKSLVVQSGAFQQGQQIPARHTCSGDDVSPALKVGNVPPVAKSLAIVMDDPDAPRGTWLHWTLWNVPPSKTSIPEGASAGELGAREGITDAR